jgi:flagellar hook-associated protein 3 FlgL
MRISSSWSQQLGINSLLDQQSKLSQSQLQLSMGKRLTASSDDPAAAVRIVDLNQSIKQAEQYQKNINVGKQRLVQEEGAVQSAVDIMHRVKDLGLQGLNASNSAADRITIAGEMKLLNNHLLGLANSKNANGEYLFSGFKTNTQPFSETVPGSGAYVYNGDTFQRNLQISLSRQLTDGDPGVNIFGTPTGVAGVAGSATNIFEAIDKFVVDMTANAPNRLSLGDLATSLDKMLTVQASVGARLNALDRQEETNADSILGMKTVLGETEDLDYAEAISKFNMQTTTLQGAQQAYSKVQQLSLFNFL